MKRQAYTFTQPDYMPCCCGEKAWQVSLRTKHFGLLNCPACGTYRIDPPSLTEGNNVTNFYTDYYQKLNRGANNSHEGIRTSRYWRVVELHSQLELLRGSVVDIGCGDGKLCAELQIAGWSSVTGIDVSQSQIALAKKLHPQIHFYDHELSKVGFELASFDLAILDNVIEHLPDPMKMVQELHRYLKPGGKVVMITPNMESGHFCLLRQLWTPELAPHVHIFLFTPNSLCNLLRRGGFEIDACGSFHLPVHSMSTWLRRLARGDVKGFLWRGLQEMGGLYGRLINRGPMLYVIGHNGY